MDIVTDIPEWVYAYVAGIVDGEGCIHLAKANRNKPNTGTSTFYPHVNVANDSKKVLEFIQKYFGGKIYTKINKINKNKIHYRWYLDSSSVEQFLLSIRPYLIIKKEQADIVLQFIREKLPTIKRLDGKYVLSSLEINRRNVLLDALIKARKEVA